MTLLETLPKEDTFENGEQVTKIIIPVGAKQGDEVMPGYVDPSWLEQTFADFINKEVPLSEADYQALLENSTDMWKLNWQEFRRQGLI